MRLSRMAHVKLISEYTIRLRRKDLHLFSSIMIGMLNKLKKICKIKTSVASGSISNGLKTQEDSMRTLSWITNKTMAESNIDK